MIGQPHMTDQAHITDHKVEKVEIGVVDPKVEIKVLEKGGTIQELDMDQVCIVNTVR